MYHQISILYKNFSYKKHEFPYDSTENNFFLQKINGKDNFFCGSSLKDICLMLSLMDILLRGMCVLLFTYPLTIKINPDNTVYAKVSDPPLELF